jgi:membrane peptidoglycan carboxypeptidase
VRDNEGDDVYVHADKPQQVLDDKVANDVTYAMKPVAQYANDPLADGRDSAAKTGTQGFARAVNENSDAWMVGFTPQVSTAVWVGSNKLGPLRTSEGRLVYGSGLPGRTWQAFMDRYLQDKEMVELTDDVQVNPELRPAPETTATGPAESRSPEPTRPSTPSPTRTPAEPTPTPKPTKSTKPPPTPKPSEPTPTPTPTRPGIDPLRQP